MKKPRKKHIGHEFKDFINEFKIIPLAVAFVLGAAANDLIKSFVNNLFMPLINPLIPDGTWETASLSIGPIKLGWGAFLSSLLHFTILSLAIFVIVKKILKAEHKK